jgi:hypothetical protein
VAKPSRIAVELEEHEKRLAEPDPAGSYEVPGKKRRRGRVRGFFKDQLVKRTSTKR